MNHCCFYILFFGNAAAVVNNHLDIFNSFSKFQIKDRQIIVPLSYGGDQFYIKDIIKYGEKIFGENFIPIQHFLSLKEYNTLLSTCSHAIFGYEQQAALGNITELLWTGVKLFLPKSSINYKYFKDHDYKVFTIEDDLTENHLSSPLTMSEKKQNRDAFLRTQSVDINLQKIQNIYKTVEKTN